MLADIDTYSLRILMIYLTTVDVLSIIMVYSTDNYLKTFGICIMIVLYIFTFIIMVKIRYFYYRNYLISRYDDLDNDNYEIKNFIINMTTIVLDDKDICYICYDDIESGIKLKCNCNAFYDKKCIIKWLEMKNICPYCQKNDPLELKT